MNPLPPNIISLPLTTRPDEGSDDDQEASQELNSISDRQADSGLLQQSSFRLR
jgi:hypothetical protein